jgi:hypothetical protein
LEQASASYLDCVTGDEDRWVIFSPNQNLYGIPSPPHPPVYFNNRTEGFAISPSVNTYFVEGCEVGLSVGIAEGAGVGDSVGENLRMGARGRVREPLG